MSKEELIQLIYTLPDSFKPEIEKFLNNPASEQHFVWELQRLYAKNGVQDKTFRAVMEALGYKNFRGNEWSKNPSAIQTHETLRDLTFALTAFVGGLAVRDAIQKSDESSSNPNYANDSNAIKALEDTGAIIGDSQSKQSVNSNWFDSFLDSFKKGASESFNNFGSNLFNTLGSIGSVLFSNSLNRENMEYLIDKQNAYNTPAQQMQRFKDAGLNPNLVYGLGSSGDQPASGSIAPVDFDTAQRENRMAKFEMALQAKQVAADIAQKQAYTNLLSTQKQGEEINNEYNAQTLNERVFMVKKQVDELCNNVELQIKEINNWDDYRKAQMDLMAAQTYAGLLSGHSIFGKIRIELDEYIKSVQDRLEKRFPGFTETFDKMRDTQIGIRTMY